MIIGICGYGYTGASAYIDMLKEFEEMQALPKNFEFTLFQQSDGVMDLKNAIVNDKRRLHINTSIHRFIKSTQDSSYNMLNRLTNGRFKTLSNEYIESIIQVSWNGKSAFDPSDIRRITDKHWFYYINLIIRKIFRIINHQFHSHLFWPPLSKRFFSIMDEEEFNIKTKKYISAVLGALGLDINKNIILEQVFSTTNPLWGIDYFDTDAISVIVDRDPRDIYLLTNVLKYEFAGFMPNHKNVEDFVTYYLKLHQPIDSEDRVIRVNFEDLIYHYDDTISYFENILKQRNTSRGKFFKPEESINNCQMYLNYPEYYDDFKYIEQRCADYLYDFDNGKNNIKITRKNVQPF